MGVWPAVIYSERHVPNEKHVMTDPSLYQGSTYFDLILQGLRRWPEREAIVDASGLGFTYAELEQRIWRIARVLRDAGLQPGDGVAQLAANRVDTFATMAAVLANGMRYTPLHPMGSLEDQLFILEDAEISALVVDVDHFAERADSLNQAAADDLLFYTLGPSELGQDLPALATQAEAEVLARLPSYEDIAWVTYTGGTTGVPKGVVMTQGSMAAKSLISMAEWQWPDDIRYLASSPISHAAGQEHVDQHHVMVGPDRLERARELLLQQVSSERTAWTCHECRTEIDSGAARCWQCGRIRTRSPKSH